MSAKTVYATVTTKTGDEIRIGGRLPDGGAQVLVSTKTAHLGWYNLDRFRGHKLTAATLRDLFNPQKEASA